MVLLYIKTALFAINSYFYILWYLLSGNNLQVYLSMI